MPIQAPSNFAPTDYSVEQLNIERQRKLSDALQAQAMQPLETGQTAGGWAVPVSPYAGLAKMLQGYSARKGMDTADKREQDLASKYSSDLAQTIASANQAAGPHAEPVDTSQDGTGSFDMSGTAGPATHIVPGSREKMIQALMQHPATQSMALSQMGQDLQRQGFMQAGGAPGVPTAAPAANPMAPGPGASVMAGGGAQTPPAAPQQAAAQSGQTGFGGPAGGQPMALWLQMDPTGAKYVEQLAKDYAPISTRYGIFQKQPDGSIKAVAGALPAGALSYQPGGGAGLLPGQAEASAQLAGAGAAGKLPYEHGTTAEGAQMPNYMIPGFQPPTLGGGAQPAAPAATAPRESPADRTAARGRQADILNSELTSEQALLKSDPQGAQGDHAANIASIQKEIANLGGAKATAGYGQTTVGKERQTGIAKSSDEYVNTLRSEAGGAVQQNRILDDLQQNLNNITPGKLAGVQKAIAEWKIAAGMGDANDQKIAASSQVVDKLTGQLVSNALRKMSARPSQMEFQIFLQKFVPNLNLTAQGAQQVVQFMRQANNLDAQKYDEFQKWKKAQPADADYRDFDVDWNRKLGTAPLGATGSFPSNDIKDIVNSGQPQPLSKQEQDELSTLRKRFGR